MRDFPPRPAGGAMRLWAVPLERSGSAAARSLRASGWARGSRRRSEEEEVAAAPGRADRDRSRRPGLRRANFVPGGGAVWRRGAAPAPPRRGAEGGAAPERGGRARATAGVGGGNAVSGAGRLRPPGILQHHRAALRPLPAPGTAAHPTGSAGKLGEGAGGGCCWAGSARRSGESHSGAATRRGPLTPEVRSGARAGRGARVRRDCWSPAMGGHCLPPAPRPGSGLCSCSRGSARCGPAQGPERSPPGGRRGWRAVPSCQPLGAGLPGSAGLPAAGANRRRHRRQSLPGWLFASSPPAW